MILINVYIVSDRIAAWKIHLKQLQLENLWSCIKWSYLHATQDHLYLNWALKP